jgi:hypothetical protein
MVVVLLILSTLKRRFSKKMKKKGRSRFDSEMDIPQLSLHKSLSTKKKTNATQKKKQKEDKPPFVVCLNLILASRSL